jgi:hypothetical protein
MGVNRVATAFVPYRTCSVGSGEAVRTAHSESGLACSVTPTDYMRRFGFRCAGLRVIGPFVRNACVHSALRNRSLPHDASKVASVCLEFSSIRFGSNPASALIANGSKDNTTVQPGASKVASGCLKFGEIRCRKHPAICFLRLSRKTTRQLVVASILQMRWRLGTRKKL